MCSYVNAQRRDCIRGNRCADGLRAVVQAGSDGDVEVIEGDISARVEIGQVTNVEIGLADAFCTCGLCCLEFVVPRSIYCGINLILAGEEE